MEYIGIGMLAVVTLILGFVFGQKTKQGKLNTKLEMLEIQLQKKADEKEKIGQQLQESDSQKNQLQQDVVRKQSQNEHLQEKLNEQKTDLVELEKRFKTEFENLAQKILDQKTEKFTEVNQKNIHQILSPLQEKIKVFEEQISKNNETFIKENSKLEQQLKHLSEQNIRISEEAQNLTKALKGDSKMQGNWGEVILERVLEKSGLTKGIEYDVQVANKNESGRTQLPDVVVHLPDQRKMIIDSKVSLTAYERYVTSEDKKEKEHALKAHLISLKNHIKGLKEKKYEDLYGVKSPDFVLLFIPIEPALFLAQSEDANFFYDAFQQNILLVSPTTLLSTLRTVEMIWKTEKQQQNALEIAKHAGNLHDKFASLIEELETLGSRIDSSKNKYQDAMKKLTGQQNLVKDIKKLKKLGVPTKKNLE
ncbi:DNA recombination protein RmuC [Psychroflexus planctonicus]|uniref:DNA recombination protein RmuC n=1 Tax=Psychroflexus planctonicus TaxID=1526575 RepID=A0ABQ1SI91_9FLAO|nr:DNA recombination protein RmuC [Psychroflexus planctonicus]GGE36868.1 DNA recombination protein RmuC [Psychroflexus planctonicus]